MISGLMIAAAIIPVAYDNLSVLRQNTSVCQAEGREAGGFSASCLDFYHKPVKTSSPKVHEGTRSLWGRRSTRSIIAFHCCKFKGSQFARSVGIPMLKRVLLSGLFIFVAWAFLD